MDGEHMRKTILTVIGLIIFLVFISSVHATLIDRGGGLIYDTDLEITWLADGNYADTSNYEGTDHINGQMTWQEAKQWAGSLVYQGYNDWRLPTMEFEGNPCTGSECTQTEALHLYFNEGVSFTSPDPFVNLKITYWSDTKNPDDPDRAKYFTTNGGYGDDAKATLYFAIAVRDGDSTPESGNNNGGGDSDGNNILGCFVDALLFGF